jgi:hypothetical protein
MKGVESCEEASGGEIAEWQYIPAAKGKEQEKSEKRKAGL